MFIHHSYLFFHGGSVPKGTIAFHLKLVAKLLCCSDLWGFTCNGVVHLECLYWFLGCLYPLLTAEGKPFLLSIQSHALTHTSESEVLSATFFLLYSFWQARAVLIFQSSYFWDHALLANKVFTRDFGDFYYSFSLCFLKLFGPYAPKSRCFLWRCCIMLEPCLHVGNFLLQFPIE